MIEHLLKAVPQVKLNCRWFGVHHQADPAKRCPPLGMRRYPSGGLPELEGKGLEIPPGSLPHEPDGNRKSMLKILLKPLN